MSKPSPGAPGQREFLRSLAHDAMLEYGLLPEFAPEVRLELASLPAPAGTAARDLRGLAWCSIDNDDSRDLDQLSVSLPQDDGSIRVLVAVADVEARVPAGGAIDRHARHNTTTVYTPAEIFPMLPEELSTDLTSLAPGEDRSAIVCEMAVDEDGRVAEAEVYQALVCNRAKLAYESTAAWLEGEGPMPPAVARVPGLASLLRDQDEAAQRLRRARLARGALEFQTIEARPVFDDGAVSEVKSEGDNRARDLIEDFMLAVNTVTAGFLERRRFPSIRRVVQSPGRWDRIEAIAAGLGEKLPPDPDPGALAAFLARRRAADPVRFPDLSVSIIKLLGAGEYRVERAGEDGPGHFGLAATDYTHSTAPNRRFPDLVTQRLVKAALAGAAVPYSEDELEQLAAHCTDMEDEARKVERRVKKAAAALVLESRVGQVFDAVVTGAAKKGTWVRLLAPPVEGRLERGFEGVDVGDRVRVRLIGTDVERGFIDFAIA
ncbi:MAG: RNB domain-containing ribonuclease [Acidobacteria bacterium]|nr:RNB domain-containing ribonuclease [Acidobacteriota bacterium]